MIMNRYDDLNEDLVRDIYDFWAVYSYGEDEENCLEELFNEIWEHLGDFDGIEIELASLKGELLNRKDITKEERNKALDLLGRLRSYKALKVSESVQLLGL